MRPNACLLVAAIALAFAGCNKRPAAPPAQAAAATAPKITVIKPELRSIHRSVEQPGTVHAFEETALFARLTGFVGSIDDDPEKKNHPPHDRRFDRGSRVRKGQVLAELAIPELNQEFRQKEALVKQAEAEVIQAEKGQVAAGAAIAVATESVREAEAGVVRAQALFVRWQSEAERIGGLVKGGLIDSQTRDETQNQLKAADAARNEAIARVAAMRAEVKKAEANRDKAAADSDAAKARLEVARANVGEVNARRTYLKIAAPYDGIVTRRSVNTGDLVSTAEKTPLFVVARIDPVRVVVRAPEADAGFVTPGQEARIAFPSAVGLDAVGRVARTAWSLEPGSRTLWTEIDLPNPKGTIRPGMYVVARLDMDFPKAWTVPAAAIGKLADEPAIYLVESSKAVRALVQVGRGDGHFTQVHRYRKPGAEKWTDFTGTESVATPAARLSDGQEVKAGE
jgi:RND family efflux transporter MFP subunit